MIVAQSIDACHIQPTYADDGELKRRCEPAGDRKLKIYSALYDTIMRMPWLFSSVESAKFARKGRTRTKVAGL